MSLVPLDAIHDAAARIGSIARRTPVVEASHLAERPLWLKCESHQPGGAFKIRGATNMLMRLDAAARARGVVTYSSGNHGQAVALAAARLGVTAVIVMPTTAPAVKVEGARALGAEILFEGTTTLHRKARAEQEQQARGLAMIPPFDHEWIIEGQGTAGLEILEQAPDVATVAVQIGGGGLIAGVSAAVKALRPAVRVIGVEPEGAAKMTASRKAGQPVTLERTVSIADGLLAVRPGDLPFLHAQQFVDEVVTVSDAAIAHATIWLFEKARLVVEPSGAAALAAVFEGRIPGTGPVVVMISGGNISRESLAALKSRHG